MEYYAFKIQCLAFCALILVNQVHSIVRVDATSRLKRQINDLHINLDQSPVNDLCNLYGAMVKTAETLKTIIELKGRPF